MTRTRPSSGSAAGRALAAVALVAAALVATPSPAAGEAAPVQVEAAVEQPRPFGYAIGDLLTQRVLLSAGERDFEPAALPGLERIGVWFERRPARVESSADGRRWMVVEYQVINAPQALRTVTLPAWNIASAAGATVLRIGEWPISMAPLTPRAAFAVGGLDELRPDHAAPTVATEPIRRQIAIWSFAFALTLVAWLAWWLQRNWRASATQPFARALREMQRIDETAPEAWQALHRAFDRTAGRVVQIATLPELFRRAPQLEALRPRIELFYLQSRERFFGAGLPADPLPLRTLCSDLRRIEKRHER